MGDHACENDLVFLVVFDTLEFHVSKHLKKTGFPDILSLKHIQHYQNGDFAYSRAIFS